MNANPTRRLQIRNVAFCVTMATFLLALGAFLGRGITTLWAGVPCVLLAVAGLAVVLLTLWLKEGLVQKCFFILTGGTGAALAITLIVFDTMVLLGCPPGGDGGGITVPMILLCPPVFLVGVIGSLVCLARADTAARAGTIVDGPQ